ncbi:carboxylesterase [Rhodococcus rhodnii]|uniref:Carboxylic ester hydrolase n=2 Tax=Rhodococcus rhodnii TaxID=38312 RepID=R7WMT1_9NOCA|nr:carboxylesterase family protein [Rhodococcus rhodnii]EOM76600.1 carboxylesterase [Rhodococcus rhodnii LMG 5362]TXG89484.1 carboxylesterase [Rhodococcus rhodnii]
MGTGREPRVRVARRFGAGAFAALLAAVLVATACSSPPDDAATADSGATDVATTGGRLHGIRDDTTTRFLGVPYARPPVGEARWTLPDAVDSPDADVDATRPGHPCPQSMPVPGGAPEPAEDCLTVNVTVPRQPRSPGPLPVMVWWHGGGYTSGAGSAYDARRLAEQGDVVVVSVNYRLGALGYLGVPGLEGGGNFGFADQIESLRWVHANAEAFGGDPGNVTVFGESAGAMSACALTTSPVADGLIDKAILASGSCMLRWPDGGLYPGVPALGPYASRDDNEQASLAAAQQLGCTGDDVIDCMRALPTESLLTVGDSFTNQLAYGTDLLPDDPAAVLRDGRRSAVPVITGGNHDEHRSFVGGLLAATPDAVTPENYADLVATAFGERTSAVLDLYPLERFPSAGIAWATVVTDSAWSCPTLAGARSMSRTAPTYLYEFADETAPNVNGITTIPQGAAHATDLPYYFDLGGESLLTTDRRREIGDQIIRYWTSFAHDAAPRVDGLPDPGPVDADTRRALRFATDETGEADVAADHRCDFWLGDEPAPQGR